MKKIIFTVCIIAILLSGCIRPPNYDGVVQIQTNEIAFLIDMTSDSATQARETVIQRKDILIPGYFVRTGRFQHQGYWRPTLKVIAVSQAPVRREWNSDQGNEVVRVTSDRGAGFIVPITLNAFIANANDATRYLAAFRPISDDNIDWSGIKQRDWPRHVKENAQPLEHSLDTAVRPRIQNELSLLFIRVPILYAEVASKIFIPAVFEGMSAQELNAQVRASLPDVVITFDRDVPSIRDWALETYGITITVMAPGDGVIYDSDDIQAQIDALSIAAMRERTLAQEQINANAEQRVREIQARTARIEAEQRSAQIPTLRAMQEIENTRLLAEAQADSIRRGNYPPVPTTLITDAQLGAFGFPGLSNLTNR